ncbi:MAG: TonB-dependent receptor [Pseudomonadota bacterium]
MTFQKTISPIIALLLGLVALPDTAAGVETVADDESGYKTVVTGKRDKEDLLVSDRSVSVIDEKELEENSPRTVPEALQNTPGVFVQETSYGGGSPVVRGMIGPQVLLLVDGVRLSNSVYRTGPLQYLNLIDPFSIRQIEVLRGPGSFLYGSDAMGGVIQVFPLEPPDLRAETGFDGGGDFLMRTSTANEGKTGHTHFYGGGRGFGMLAGLTYKGFENLVAGDGVGEQIYSGYDNYSALGSAAYRFSGGFAEDWYVKAGYLFSRISGAGRTDKLFDSHALSIYDNDDHLLYGRLHMRFPSIKTSGNLTFSFQHFFERMDSHKMAGDLRTKVSTTRDEVTALTMGADIEFVTKILKDRLRLQYGGMWYRDWVGAERMTGTPDTPWQESVDKAYPDGSTYDTGGAYVMLSGDVVRARSLHILRLKAGYRFAGMAANARAHEDLDAVSFDNLAHVLIAGAQYIYADSATIVFSFSQGFRSPNLQESAMLGDTGKFFHVPNDELKPEKSDTFELMGRARAGRLTLGCAGYVSLLHDLIKRVGTTWDGRTEIGGKPVTRNVNGREGILFGAELELSLVLGRGFSLFGHLAYTWGEEYVDEGPDVPLTRIPPVFGQVGLRYTSPAKKKLRGFAETYFRLAGRQHRLSPEDESDARIPEGGTPGWWTWNVRGGIVVVDRFRLGLVVENLLNKAYKYHASGIYSPGTNAVITAELTFF